jgi:hypothetical protein
MNGSTPATADGRSQQPFDGAVHKDHNAQERRKNTLTLGSHDTWISFAPGGAPPGPGGSTHDPRIGEVKVDEYRGKDWDRLSPNEIFEALQVRATLQIKFLRNKYIGTKNNGQPKDKGMDIKLQAIGKTNADLGELLDLAYINIINKGRP